MMKRAFLLVLSLTFGLSTFAQVSYKSFDSKTLNSVRKLKVKLPRNYDEDSTLKYPVVVVFDGEYLFEPVAGQTDYQTYFDDMPGSIIVGVLHEESRSSDMHSDEVSGLPIDFGAKFFEFVSTELIPYIDKEYNTSNFRVAVGHNITANFINAFMFKDSPLFKAYVNISPDFMGSMSENIVNRSQWINNDIIYYLATSKDDIKHIRQEVLRINSDLEQIDNTKFTYYFDDFDEASHYSMVARGISRAFDKIFDIYKPISQNEIKDKVMPYEGTLDTYIVNRYKKIENLFGIEKPIKEEEFQKLAEAAIRREDIKSLEKLGKLGNQHYPNSNLGTYYLALNAEIQGNTKRAMKLYESALTLDDSTIIDKESLMSKVEDLKIVSGEND